MSLPWNEPGNLIKSAWTSNTGFPEAHNKSLDCFWCSHLKSPKTSLWRLSVGFLHNRSRKSNSTASPMRLDRKYKWVNCSAIILFAKISSLRKKQNNKAASLISTCASVSSLSSLLMTALVMPRAQHTNTGGSIRIPLEEMTASTLGERIFPKGHYASRPWAWLY